MADDILNRITRWCNWNVLVVFLLASPAMAQDAVQEFWNDPEIRACCSDADGSRVTLGMDGAQMYVMHKGQRVYVPRNKITKHPSPYQKPIAWFYTDENGKPALRCLALSGGF